MISRSTVLALTFACLATLSLAGVASASRQISIDAATAPKMAVHELPRVVITGKVRSAGERQPGN